MSGQHSSSLAAINIKLLCCLMHHYNRNACTVKLSPPAPTYIVLKVIL